MINWDGTKDFTFSRGTIQSLKIAVDRHLDCYRAMGYTQQDIDAAPDDSHFGALRDFSKLAQEFIRE